MNAADSFDLIVVGDEVESILSAVSAARLGISVALVRQSNDWLGGLSTRGGLSYMDITPEYKPPLFKEFLDAAEVILVALDPDKAHRALADMLTKANVTVFDDAMHELIGKNPWRLQITPHSNAHQGESDPYGSSLADGSRFPPQGGRGSVIEGRILIDATPDGDIARQLRIPYLLGMGDLFNGDSYFLGISPVFNIEGVSVEGLRTFEETIRQRSDMESLLKTALPYHAPELIKEYLTRPTYSPDDMDYLDILNPAIGIAFHHWKHGEVDSYAEAPIAIDGGNISLLHNKTRMGFNGMVMRADALMKRHREWEAELLSLLINYSHGKEIPAVLLDEMQAFEQFLQSEGGFSAAKIIPPKQLYIRQTLTLQARKNMSAQVMLSGGVDKEKAIGTYSYWLDTRGIVLSKYFSQDSPLPKPVFNVGIDVALPANPGLEHFAFVGRSAGYSPMGQGTGRIVQHNAMIGEAVGVAAALSIQKKTTLGNIPAGEIRDVLAERNGGEITLEGKATWPPERIAQSELLQRDAEALGILGVVYS